MFKLLILAFAITGCNACKSGEKKSGQPTEYDRERCLASCSKVDAELDCDKICPVLPKKEKK
jgi:hypothetical protein